ncbi:MAG: hypothetical protein CVT94_10025 [Bacteroidetes bacterium HGW-Bacteroidetes-11]|nr:MAG: hypothetical protein CVT94_10025 [Bacteroidetes bacterium HGW-Bacteroidetes-11]
MIFELVALSLKLMLFLARYFYLKRPPLTGLRALSKWEARQMHANLFIGSKTLSGVSGFNRKYFFTF